MTNPGFLLELEKILSNVLDCIIMGTGTDFGKIQVYGTSSQDQVIVVQGNLPDPETKPIHQISLRNSAFEAIGVLSIYDCQSDCLLKDSLTFLEKMAGVTTNIIEQFQHKLLVAQSASDYLEIFKHTPKALCLVKMPEGIIVDASNAYLELFGFNREELIGKRSIELGLSTPESEIPVRSSMKEQGSIYDHEFVSRAKSGELKPLRLTIVPIRIGGAEHWLVVIQDLSDKKRMEFAEESNRIKDLFLTTLSHELRTPLTAILSWAQLLKRTRNQEMVDKGLETIESSAKIQKQLIDDLLDYARLTTGKMRLNLESANLGKTILDCIETLRPEFNKKKFAVQIFLPPQFIFVKVDTIRIRQIFWNLFSNSIKFTPEGGSIGVVLRNLGERAQIEISDNGRGFRPELAESIFDRFSQGDPSTTREFGGLGLGLSLIRDLVDLQNGSIKGESPGIGKGATFTLEFPIERIEEPKANDSNAPKTKSRLNGIRILLVEDEALIAEGIAGLLEHLGAIVHRCFSVKEALSYLSHDVPDLLISDLAMPFEDGFSLIRKVRACEKQRIRALPAIALTAYAATEIREKVKVAGFTGFASKPLDLDLLISEIDRVAKHSHIQKSLESLT